MAGLIDVSSITKVAKNDDGLMAQPANPTFRTAVVQIYVPSQALGGSDKLTNGHRFDSVPIANGMIKVGMSCQLLHYTPAEHEKFFRVLDQFDAVVVRCNPGHIQAAGGDQALFDEAMTEIQKTRPVWPTAEVMATMGAKDALCCIKDMDFGLPDTLGYYSPADILQGFKKSIAFQPRVVKQNRGSAGEGIWIIKLKSGNYCKNYGDRCCADDEMLVLTEANDNHIEEHTVGEFVEFTINGRTAKSGTWKSIGTGKYFDGGKEAGGQMVDQRYLPRIDEGEARFMMVGKELLRIEHYVYVGGVGGEIKTTIYGPDAPQYLETRRKLENDVPAIMKALGLSVSALPLLWAADFIPVDNHATPLVVGEFNCSCLGVAGFLTARGKDLSVVSKDDAEMGQKMCDLIGKKALEQLLLGPVDIMSLTRIAKDNDGLLPQPRNPLFKCALVEIYASSQPMGGSDKLTNGHRFDSIPIANGFIKAGMACQPVHYVPEEHDEFCRVMEQFDGVLVRCNPGHINAAGGDQNKFDAAMMKLAQKIPVWPTGDVMASMGAKDALCCIKDMDFGLPDTLGYYCPEDIIEGFPKAIAFQPRVVKQNRGSAGEGIWIIKLKANNYCKNYGDRVCSPDEILILKEANDNHVEEHSVREFMEFCINGRNGISGNWTSKGTGKYFEGGREAGGQMVDQRYLPRIDEGEARFMLIGTELIRVEHYVYVGGVGGEIKTTIYGPDEPKYLATKNKLKEECPKIMKALGLTMSKLPLLWAADFIPVDNHPTPLVVGEFNCSCLGVAGYLNARGKDLSVLSQADRDMGDNMCNLIGLKALEQLKLGPVNIGTLSRLAKDNDCLLDQPKNPSFKCALIEIYNTSQPGGGSDKLTNGHRFDSIPMCNGFIKAGMSCQPFHYVPEEHDEFFRVLEQFEGVIVRCNPGHIDAAGGSQNKFDAAMMEVAKRIPVWPTADTMASMGAKDALCCIKSMDFGLPDTLGYYSPQDIRTGFRKAIAYQPRVVKQNRGSAGEGIWIIKLKAGNYCKNYGDRVCEDNEMLLLKEANDNHTEEHTVAEFVEFCINGRTQKSGTWTSVGTGRYFEGGREAGGQMVDQRFLPRIDEGEARFMVVGRELYRIEHYVYVGGVGGEIKTTIYGPDAPEYALTKAKLEREIPEIMTALGLSMSKLPLLWAADFIPVDNHPTPLVVGEFNCSCLGVAGFLNARGKDLSVLSQADKDMGQKMCDLIGEKALELLKMGPVDIGSLTRVAKNNDGLMSQPKNPKFKCALIQIYVPSQPGGGSDKLTNGHRFDSIPMCNGFIKAGISCQPFHYVPEEHDEFFRVLSQFDGVVVRQNPGHINAAGGDQNKFDAAINEIQKRVPVWPQADVMASMGAKDALCCIRDMDFGLPDTLGYYSPDDIKEGFRKSIAFQPRVVKQNRGSAGEGIWIIKLKSGNYCKNYGDRLCSDDEMLILTEANDNHVEEHTVGEFVEFCINGRTSKSGTWKSIGTGKYFEGGREAGGQMVDQRFLPRIDEGEARFMMVGMDLYRIEHYVYVGGVGGEIKTTIYGPDAPEFAETKRKLEVDTPAIMEALGLSMAQLPLLWAADFIPVDNHPTPLVVGEFNCSCLGVAGFLNARGKDLSVITKDEFKMGQKMCDLIGKKALEALKTNATAQIGQPKPGVFKLVLLRHGESDWNVKNIFTGWADVDLSENGKQEAVDAGKMIKAAGFRFNIVFTSVLRRAIRTAWTALMESENFSMPVINTWRLNERHYGGLQGLNKAETAKKHGDKQVKIWRRSYDIPPPAIPMTDPRHPCNDPLYRHVPKAALPGAESLKLTVDRVLPFWFDTIAPCVMAGKSVMVAAHGNSLRAICKYLENMSEEEVMNFNIPTGVPLVYELTYDLQFIKKYYLMDEDEVAKKIAAVANQGKAKAITKLQVLFVLGGPGAGKGTQCARITASKQHWGHISAGDVLRAERTNPQSEVGELINSMIKEGKLVPSKITVGLLEKEMLAQQKQGKTHFLIDGFPRSIENAERWAEVIGSRADVLGILFFDAQEQELERRLIERGKTSGRADDNKESIQKRFKTYQEETMPVINSSLFQIFKVNGMNPEEEVWQNTSAVLAKVEGR